MGNKSIENRINKIMELDRQADDLKKQADADRKSVV
jgi:hypothetical protein